MKRSPFIATLLHFISSGLGFFYMGFSFSKSFLIGLGLVVFSFLGAFLVSFSFPFFVIILFLSVVLSIGMVIWIFKLAKSKERPAVRQSFKNYFLFFLAMLVVTRLLGYLQDSETFYIPSESMSPSLLAGDYVVVSHWYPKIHGIKRGDILAFQRIDMDGSEKVFIDRVIGIEGDTVEMRDGIPFVNGTALIQDLVDLQANPDEQLLYEKTNAGLSYLITHRPHLKKLSDELKQSLKEQTGKDCIEAGANTLTAVLRNICVTTVPPKSYYVLGDNRDNSVDSRTWGFVTNDQVLGVVKYVYFSKTPQSGSIRWERINSLQQK